MNFRNLLVAAAATSAVVGLTSVPAQAANLFGNSGIQFGKDTEINFKFLDSHGKFSSKFGVYEVNGTTKTLVSSQITEKGSGYIKPMTDDFKGECDVCNFTFKFLAGKTYTLGLKSFLSNALKTTVYSTNAFNNPVEQNAVFENDTLAHGITINFDDNGNNNDNDLNDFTVEARSKTVPEPATLTGLGLAAGSLLLSRRRKASQAS